MMPRTSPRTDRVKKQGMVWLAGAGLWIAIGAAVILPPDRAGWVRVTAAFGYGLAALSFIAVYAARRRRGRPAGSGLSVRGRARGARGEVITGPQPGRRSCCSR